MIKVPIGFFTALCTKWGQNALIWFNFLGIFLLKILFFTAYCHMYEMGSKSIDLV